MLFFIQEFGLVINALTRFKECVLLTSTNALNLLSSFEVMWRESELNGEFSPTKIRERHCNLFNPSVISGLLMTAKKINIYLRSLSWIESSTLEYSFRIKGQICLTLSKLKFYVFIFLWSCKWTPVCRLCMPLLNYQNTCTRRKMGILDNRSKQIQVIIGHFGNWRVYLDFKRLSHRLIHLKKTKSIYKI